MANHYNEGQRSFERGCSQCPYKYEPHAIEWTRGYKDAEAAERKRQQEAYEYEQRWKYLPESYRLTHELEQKLPEEVVALIIELIKAVIKEETN